MTLDNIPISILASFLANTLQAPVLVTRGFKKYMINKFILEYLKRQVKAASLDNLFHFVECYMVVPCVGLVRLYLLDRLRLVA